MKKIYLPLALLLIANASFTSCKKEDKTSPRHDMVAGTWKTYQSGVDSDNNGVWDTNEITTTTGSDIETYTFKGDGTGSVSFDFLGAPLSFDLTWNLENNDNDIKIVETVYGQPYTSTQHIISFVDKNVVLKDDSVSPTAYLSLNKQ